VTHLPKPCLRKQGASHKGEVKVKHIFRIDVLQAKNYGTVVGIPV
jgi:hypothetical protein